MTDRPSSTNRDVRKQGYLKKVPHQKLLGATFKRPDKRWFVFGIFSGREPYLEYYANQDDIYTADPLKYISLSNTCHVTPGLIGGKNGHLFTIVTAMREFCLIAATREEMHDWISTIETSLRDLNILQTINGGGTVYDAENSLNQVNCRTSEPAHHRSPTQPLPTPPPQRTVKVESAEGAQIYDVPPRRYPPPSPEGEYQVPGSVYQRPSSLPHTPNANTWETFQSDDPLTSIYSAPSSLPVSHNELPSSTVLPTNPVESQSHAANQLPSCLASIPNPESGASSEAASPVPTSAINVTDAASTDESTAQSVTMATAGPASRRRLDLNFFPGSTVVDLVEEQSAASPSNEDDGDIYAPLWNEEGAASPTIPPIPPPLRNKDKKRSQSVPDAIPLIPDRRRSRTLSMVAGQGRPAGETALPEEPVISAARMPGQPSRDRSIRMAVPGLPENPDIPLQRAPPIPKPRAMSVDSSAPAHRVPPRPARTPDTGTYQVPAARPRPSPGNTTYEVPSSQPQLAVQNATYEMSRHPQSPQSPSSAISPHPPYTPTSTPQNLMGGPPAYTPDSRGRSMSVATPPTPMSPLNPPVYPQTPGRSLSVGAIYLGANSNPPPEVSEVDLGPDLSVLPSKMMEAMGLGDEEDAVGGWNMPPPDDAGVGAPPPYMARGMLNRGAHKSLKQSQVSLLQKEMDHPGGVKVTLRRVDCHHAIALVECFGTVWVGGWNQQARPFLHNAFHVGDQVISINFQVVENARMAYKLIKHSGNDEKIVFIVKRVPKARVLAVRRETTGQDLGLRRRGGTGEIVDVEPFSLVVQHGLPVKAPSVDTRNICNWWITEVNHRPVNLFYKGDEIEKRLNAVGLDISILVQPSELVEEFRRQIKVMKNYKDFIVQ